MPNAPASESAFKPHFLYLSFVLTFFCAAQVRAQTTDMCEATIVGVNPEMGFHGKDNACDRTPNLINAIRAEIAKALCFEAADPVCLSEIYRRDSTMIGCGAKVTSLDDLIRCHVDAKRFVDFESSQTNRVFKAWVSPGPDSLEKIDERLQKKEEEIYSNDSKSNVGAMTDTLTDVIGLVPNPVIRTMIGVLDVAKNVFRPAEEEFSPKFEKSKECGLQSIHIPAIVTKSGSCSADYSVMTPAVKNFLAQSDDFHKKGLRCLPTCAYYRMLLMSLIYRNRTQESLFLNRVELKTIPRCGPEAGRVRFSVDAKTEKWDVSAAPENAVVEIDASLSGAFTYNFSARDPQAKAGQSFLSGKVGYSNVYEQRKQSDLTGPGPAGKGSAFYHPEASFGKSRRIHKSSGVGVDRLTSDLARIASVAAICCTEKGAKTCRPSTVSRVQEPLTVIQSDTGIQ